MLSQRNDLGPIYRRRHRIHVRGWQIRFWRKVRKRQKIVTHQFFDFHSRVYFTIPFCMQVEIIFYDTYFFRISLRSPNYYFFCSCNAAVNPDWDLTVNPCFWEYSGQVNKWSASNAFWCENLTTLWFLQGIEYQILAGPVFVVIFTIAGIFMGILGEKKILLWMIP